MKTWSRGEYEVDERWISIDAYTMSNLHPATRVNQDVLARTRKSSDEKGLPDIDCPSPQYVSFLQNAPDPVRHI